MSVSSNPELSFINSEWMEGIDRAVLGDLVYEAQCSPPDQAARYFGQVIDMTYPSVFNLAISLTGSREGAEEVAQGTMLCAWRSHKTFRESAQFSTWLYRIVKNQAINYRQAQDRRTNREVLTDFSLHEEHLEPDNLPFQIEDPNSGDTLEEALILEDFKKSSSRLSDNDRTILSLRVCGFNDMEAANYLGINNVAAKVRLHRARRHISQFFNKSE